MNLGQHEEPIQTWMVINMIENHAFERTGYGCVHKQAPKFSLFKMCLDKSVIYVIGK
jgi:hypothetical protein